MLEYKFVLWGYYLNWIFLKLNRKKNTNRTFLLGNFIIKQTLFKSKAGYDIRVIEDTLKNYNFNYLIKKKKT